jgi:hypothetical protein
VLRFKLIGAVSAFAAIGLIGTWLLVGAVKGGADEALRQRVDASARAWGGLNELQGRRLAEIAAQVQASEVPARLSALNRVRDRLYALERASYERHPKDAAARAALVREDIGLLGAYAKAVADELSVRKGVAGLSARDREAIERAERETLVRCLAISVSQCAFDLSYPTLQSVANALEGPARHPDHLVVTDDRLVGLAQAEQPLWSDREDFAKDVPLVAATRHGAITRSLVRFEGDPRYHLGLAAPLKDARGAFVGAVLAAIAVDPIRSTLTPDALGAVTELVAASGEPGQAGGGYGLEANDDLIAAVIAVPGAGDGRFDQVALTLDRSEALASFDALAKWLGLLAAAMLLGMLGAMALAWRSFSRVGEAIESALHEVADGDREPPLSTAWTEPLWANLSIALNRALAREAGVKEEELSDPESWAEEVLHDTEVPPPDAEVPPQGATGAGAPKG